LTNTEADVAALAEINVSWKLVHPPDQLHKRMWGWFSALHISHSYASNFPAPSVSLAGGTAVFTIADAAHLVAEKSQDTFGRWSSMKLRGRNGISIRIISAYRCVRNIYGPLSVWNQQRYLYDLEKISADPIVKFDQDIGEFISQCLQAGEQVVLSIDANEDTRVGPFNELMTSVGLTELMSHKHGQHAPPTYSRGSLPIDAIFVSANCTNCQCGYLPISSDHRVLWVDIPYTIALGRNIPAFPYRRPQRLTLQDPRVVKKYLTDLTTFLQNHDVLKRAQDLWEPVDSGISAGHVREYNAIDELRTKGILWADKRCRKIRMGQVDFSPTLVMAWNKIKAWQLVKRKFAGQKVKSRYLFRALKAAGILDISLLTLSDATEHLASALSIYKRAKKEATTL
jgi:hypothetical protein